MATILLATADSALYDILSSEIIGEGHHVQWVVDGREAQESILAQHPDLVLFEPNLRVFNGLELCEMLRKDPDIPRSLPLILLSDEAINPKQVEKAGVTQCFPKTHALYEVRDLLAAHLPPEAMP